MTVFEIIEKTGFEVLNIDDESKDREISGVYCCDLLSVVMSKGFENCAWITIMGNINAVAVAELIDAGIVILAKETALDENMITKAKDRGIVVVKSEKPIYETAIILNNILSEDA